MVQTVTGDERRERRAARIQARAERLQAAGLSQISRAREMASVIPFGQPILIGHHSERRDRRYREKITAKFRKGFEAIQAAERAASVRPSHAIMSGDSDAVAQLRAKVAKLEAAQEQMKAANKLIRKNDRAGLAALGFTEEQVNRLLTKDCMGTIGFASWRITNNGAEIRRAKARLAQLEAAKSAAPTERIHGAVRIVEDTEAMRMRLHFPGKPERRIIDELKTYGFRWAPSEGAWQLTLNNRARWAVEQVLKLVPAEG